MLVVADSAVLNTAVVLSGDRKHMTEEGVRRKFL